MTVGWRGEKEKDHRKRGQGNGLHDSSTSIMGQGLGMGMGLEMGQRCVSAAFHSTCSIKSSGEAKLEGLRE